ncbi:Toll-like receptor 2 type-2 [Acropora cervicornis]|uniref:Toll-like receptor 2 type-2 n=1 Tax=Acropora cervicornis TaxID=6130 RepID=A0AAD9PXU1_ACRCE|nr:Toll-like receptor 2 type-2 [Acropora cervicornis]
MQDLKCQNGTLSNGVSKSPSEPILTAATNGPTKIVNEGNDPTFHCIVHSSLPANITWFYNGKPLMNDSLHRYFQCNTVLQLRRVSSKDAGNYSCVVNSALGKATASSRLSVILRHKDPIILFMGLDDDKNSNTAIVGSNVNLTCKIHNPQIQNTFEKNGRDLDEDKDYTYHNFGEGEIKRSVLEIKNVTLEDEGNYTCVAFREGATTRFTFYLKVEATVSPDDSSTKTLALVFGGIGVLILLGLAFISLRNRTQRLSRYLTQGSRNNNQEARVPLSQTELSVTQIEPNGECVNEANHNHENVEKRPPEKDYDARYDVFICYSYKDIGWVKELVAELEKLHFVCCIDYRDFVPGAAIVENISEAIYYSAKTIAVLSPNFLNSEWCNRELQQALTRTRKHQVVPIVYRSCAIPLTLQDRTYLDWENCLVKPFFWEQLEKALKRPCAGWIGQ